MYKCGSCEIEASCKEPICHSCGILKNEKFNLFEILSVKEDFNLDLAEIEKKYLLLQKKIHPDNFGAEDYQKNISFKLSSLANEAYKTLKDKRKRGEYILSLAGIIVNSDHDNVQADQAMLQEIFFIRDGLQEATQIEQLDMAKNKNELMINQTFEIITNLFAKKDLMSAAHNLIKARYLEKIKDEINIKYQNEFNTNH